MLARNWPASDRTRSVSRHDPIPHRDRGVTTEAPQPSLLTAATGSISTLGLATFLEPKPPS
jgi:hypothetical protein